MSDTHDVVRARAFELIGPDDKVVAKLEYCAGALPGSSLWLAGPASGRIALAVEGDKAEIRLLSRSGRARASLTVRENDNGTKLLIRDNHEKVRVEMGTDPAGETFLTVYGKDGNTLWQIPPEHPPAN